MDKFSELKAAAMAATPGRIGDRIDGSGSIKYECTGYDGSLVLRTNHKDMEYGFVGDNADADELFFRLCVPDVVLELLAELEAKDERIGELEVIATEYAGKFQKAQDALKYTAIMSDEDKKKIAELERILDGVTPVMIAGGWTAKGISDYAKSLEAKLATPVRLPRPACVYADHSYPAYSRKQVEEIITSAGMRFTVEGDE